MGCCKSIRRKIKKQAKRTGRQIGKQAKRTGKQIEKGARRIRNDAAGMLGMGGAPQGSETAISLGTLGLGQVGEEEEKAKKDKKKTNTLRKKKLGTRGAAVPLQSTKTISGDASTRGVQI